MNMQVSTRDVPRLADTLTVEGYEFKLWVTDNDGPDPKCLPRPTFGVRIGPSWDDACVEISVTARGHMLPFSSAAMSSLKYMPCCSSSAKELLKGGGSATMLRAACDWVSRTYSYVERITFTDTSHVVLDSASGTSASLAALMLSYTGKTWYEREFGAELQGDHGTYRALVSAGLCSPAGKTLSFEAFASKFRIPQDHMPTLAAAYNQHDTLVSFFADLKAAHPCNQGSGPCFADLVWPWVDNVIFSYTEGKHTQEWFIRLPLANTQVSEGKDAWGSACCAGCCIAVQRGLGSFIARSPPTRRSPLAGVMYFPLEAI